MKLPLVSSKELCAFLQKEGFICIRQKGSHRTFKHADGRMTVIPVHSGWPIGKGLLLKILDDVDMPRDEFLRKYG